MRLFKLLGGLLFLTACDVLPSSEADLNASKPSDTRSSVRFSLSEADLSSQQVLIEYTNAAGEAAQATLPLSVHEEKLASEALELEPGNYTLTQFLVLKNDEISFATPQQTSSLAGVVGEGNALPIPFSVSAGKITHLNPMVLTTGEHEGEDFLLSRSRGTHSWKSIIMARIVALVPNGSGGTIPTSATLAIGDGNGRRIYRLMPGINHICLLSNAEQFSLSMKKDGYAPFEQAFSRAQLASSAAAGKEIKIQLSPVETPSLKGRILDAVYGAPVRDVTVQLLSNNMEIAKDTTKVDGSYNLGNVPAGQHTIVISKSGHISYGQLVTLAVYDHKNVRLPIARVMPANQMRIVLTWEDKHSDLDAYLRIIKASNNTEVATIFWDRLSFKNNIAKAVFTTGDDRFGLGFESMSLTVDHLGVYKFQYFDRRYHKSNHTKPFPLVGASVKVFRGDSVMGIFDPNMLSQDQNLKQYNVFEIAPDLSVMPVNVLQ